jgi:hypothetical protein
MRKDPIMRQGIDCVIRFAASAVFLCFAVESASAATINFGGNRNGLHGAAAGVALSGEWQMSLASGPAGAVFHESSASTLGVDGRGVSGALDVGDRFGPDKLNLLGGDAPAAGTSESVTFSFNRPGVLDALRLDGVKDETLEYIRLQTPGNGPLLLFDFDAEMRLTQQGFSLAALVSEPWRLFDDADDDATGLGIPFAAGADFVLTYGELPYPQGYVPLTPNQPPNGARWQGLVVNSAPEPSAACLIVTAAISVTWVRRRVVVSV